MVYIFKKIFFNDMNVYFIFFQVEMAHKVLSKDMSDLVNAMKLVEKYSSTTVEGEYRK